SVRGSVRHRISESRWTADDVTGPLCLCRGRSLGPLSPDYVPGLEHPPPLAYVPEFVPEPVYPEFMPPEDDVLLAEEQPLPVAISLTANSPGYIPESDPEEDPEEEDEDLEESSEDDDDDEEEEEEHPASADSIPPHVHCVTAKMLRAESPSTSHPPPPIVLPHTRASMAKLRAAAPSTNILVSERSSAPTTRPTRDTWDEMIEDMQGTPIATDVAGLSQRMIDFVTTVRQDTDKIYGRLDDAQDERLLMSGQLNMLRRDRRAHARTARLMESKAKLSREAWVQSKDATARAEVISLRTTVLAQQAKIVGSHAVDRTRQT
nr:hypothetical protein [Tanacetum cinerariifolium]